jgi:hypothetical protein
LPSGRAPSLASSSLAPQATTPREKTKKKALEQRIAFVPRSEGVARLGVKATFFFVRQSFLSRYPRLRG